MKATVTIGSGPLWYDTGKFPGFLDFREIGAEVGERDVALAVWTQYAVWTHYE